MVLWRSRAVVLDHEQGARVFLHVQQDVVDVVQEELDALLIQGSVRQHASQLHEEP